MNDKTYTNEDGTPRHDSMGYRGGGVYACSCGHRLMTLTSGGALHEEEETMIVTLKARWMAHRLDAEPEALTEEVR